MSDAVLLVVDGHWDCGCQFLVLREELLLPSS
jgi:hypothetical protein